MWSSDRLMYVAAAAALLAGCGFQLRGQAQLPFETLYIPGGSPLVVELKRNVAAASKTRLVDSVGDAQAVLGFTQELRDKVILSFNTQGRVSEYQLRYRVGFRVTDPKGGQVYLPTSEVLLTRDMAYSDAQVLAKEAEEALLYRDMQSDMVQQILRRLVAAKPVPTQTD
ncbi:MAG TPA: LPS assembly lipoprotein LptE [Burkholderiales bacterium]|nr:LPS assembly lipoprotein LptE [Burkholderiales bacterium]